MSNPEQAQFISVWDREAQSTLAVLRALPATHYDLRPDAGGRSLGELGWHMTEIDAYISDGVANGAFDFAKKLPGLERPRTVGELAPGYERVHRDSVARIAAMSGEAFNAQVDFMGHPMRAADILWMAIVQHAIHHRGQLVLLCRIAGGMPPGLYGPTREQMAAMQRA